MFGMGSTGWMANPGRHVVAALGFLIIFSGTEAFLQAQVTVTPIAQVQKPGSEGNASAMVGQQVTVTGRVTVPYGVFNSGSFYILDATGGIQCYLLNNNVKLGDSLLVTGKVSEYNGETEIVPSGLGDIRFLGSGKPPLPFFFPLSIPASQRERYEGWFVRTWGIVQSLSSDSFSLDDGKGRIKVYIDRDTGIQLTGLQVGDAIGVVGVLSEYRGNYELKPRFPSDIWLSGQLSGDGNGVAAILPAVVQASSQVDLRFTLRADSTFSIGTVALKLPDGWSWSGRAGDLRLEGSGFAGASVGYLAADSLVITGGSISDTSGGTVVLQQVAAPFQNGNFTFHVYTAVPGGQLARIYRCPSVVTQGGMDVMTAIHQVDSSGVPVLLGRRVQVEGVVTAADVFPGWVFLQNSNGGVALRQARAGADLNAGDQLRVSGVVSQQKGLTFLDSVQVLARTAGGTLPQPVLTTIANIQGQYLDGIEELESRLIRLPSVKTDSTHWHIRQAATDFIFTDGTRQIAVRLYAGNTLNGLPIPRGLFSLSGILIQEDPDAPFHEGYVLLPRGIQDVQTGGGPQFVRPPEIADMSSTSITLEWELDEPARALVQYGRTAQLEAPPFFSPDSTAYHRVTLTGLHPATVYRFRVVAWNGAGVRAAKTFLGITASHPESTGEILVYFNRSVETGVSRTVPALGDVDVKSVLISRIEQANYSIDLCLYSFNFYNYSTNRDPVVEALLRARDRGVKIRFIYDSTHDQPSAELLKNAGIPLIDNTFGQNYAEGVQHNKFIIFDARDTTSFTDDWVWTGSYNVTSLSQNENAENVILIQDEALAKVFTMEFEEMWGGSGDLPDPERARFGPRKTDNTPHKVKVNGRWIECYFSPTDGLAQAVSRAIHSADYSIAFSLLIFTSNPIFSAMAQRSSVKPGLAIYGVLESDNHAASGSEWDNLVGMGWDVHLDALPGWLHHKYAVIDWGTDSDPLLVTGSYNWTQSAEERNDENLIIVHDPVVADQYWQEFAARYHEAGGASPLTSVEDKPDLPGNLRLAVYPNPFVRGRGQNNLYIQFPQTGRNSAGETRRPGELRIVNLLGQTVWKQRVGTGERQALLPAVRFSSGVYFVVYRLPNGKTLKRKILIF